MAKAGGIPPDNAETDGNAGMRPAILPAEKLLHFRRRLLIFLVKIFSN